MRRPRDLAIRAGFYLAATLTGIAAAYVLKEWFYHIWDPRIDNPDPADDSGPADDPPVSEPTLPDPVPDPDTESDAYSPPPTLPPLRVNSLPPPVPIGLSGSFYSVNPDSLTSPTPLTALFHMSNAEDSEASSQTTTSDTDSFVDVLSPHPPAQVITRRRSFFRNHDLFAESHLSFSQLGNLVAPEDDSESD